MFVFSWKTQLKQKEISPILARLKLLENFYYQSFSPKRKANQQVDMDNFLLACRILGESCSLLKTITEVGFYPLGAYLVGNVVRGSEGSVLKIVPGRGFGVESMEGVNDPFPVTISPH